MTEEFFIENTALSAELNPLQSTSNNFEVRSVPHPYKIEWLAGDVSPVSLVNADGSAILLVDAHIRELWFENLAPEIPVFEVDATESKKNIYAAIDFAEFMESVDTTKANMVYVCGGGIMQDLGAFACAIYKRGVPWTYLPTTLLGMVDSCIGGKTGLNHNSTKNLIALFSAPRRIIHYLPFLNTLPAREIVSGFGEALRLHATGGGRFFTQFESNIDKAIAGDLDALQCIILGSLSVKRAVVQEDEFENSLRRSMNYGHSIGHAIEALTNFAFPHGMAVSIGIMVENVIATFAYGLNEEDASRINIQARKLIDHEAEVSLRSIDFSEINSVLQKDKKTVGNILKLAVPSSLGDMQIHDFRLDNAAPSIIKEAFEKSDLI